MSAWKWLFSPIQFLSYLFSNLSYSSFIKGNKTALDWREVNNQHNSDCVGLCRPLLITTKDFGLLWQSPHLWGRRSLSGGDERDSFQLGRYKKKALIYYFIRNGSVKKTHTHRLARKGFLPNYEVHCMIQYHFQPRITVLCLRLSSGMLRAVPSRYQSLET